MKCVGEKFFKIMVIVHKRKVRAIRSNKNRVEILRIIVGRFTEKAKLHVFFQSLMYLVYDRILDPIESKFRTPQKASDGLAHCFFVHTSLPRTLAQLPSSTLEFTN